jgi:hypothetical protein
LTSADARGPGRGWGGWGRWATGQGPRASGGGLARSNVCLSGRHPCISSNVMSFHARQDALASFRNMCASLSLYVCVSVW